MQPNNILKQNDAGHAAASVPVPADRRLVHRRAIDVRVYARADGLWDAEAELIDTKARDFALATGMRPAGEPIHSMCIRLTVTREFQVVDVDARTLAAPYPGFCEDFGDAYRSLVGLNLLRGFSNEARQRLHGVRGCTHLTELLRVLPTAVVQGFAGEVVAAEHGDDVQPFQLDRCHALRLDGPVVMRYYPRWVRSAEPIQAD